ncbi:hypothetical protein RUM44_012322 [Polyplax serrata]|uniref:Major facilitator superfamily (MFS) profile domain-containing protein n=1 Tax=Polyplax serrata TaxID=468196 RepID=A0ABR1BER0_POLSC
MTVVLEVEGENDGKVTLKGLWTQYAVTFVVNLGAFSIGTLLGWTSQAVPNLKSESSVIKLTDNELSWIAGFMPLGAAFSGVPVLVVMKHLGRKLTLLSVVPFYVLGFCLLAWANNVDMFYAGRFITGMSGGAFSIISPLYTAEIGEKRIRGSLGTYYEFMLAVGVEFSYIVGGYVSVFWLCLTSGAIPVVFACIFVFMPETPYHLVSQGEKAREASNGAHGGDSDGKTEEAVKSLKFLRGTNKVDGELEEIRKFVNESKTKNFSWRVLKSRAAIKSVLIGFWLMVFQQFGGANAVVFNATTIFQEAGSTLEPSKATMVVGFMQFGGNFLSMLLIDRLGRRILLLLSGTVMGTCTLLLGFYFHWLSNNENVDKVKWLPLLCLCLFMIMFSIGWGPVAWMMLGEIFDTEIKSVASSFCCATNWIATFLVTRKSGCKNTCSKLIDAYFGDLIVAFGQDWTFWLFTVVSALGVAFVYFLVPETKGKTLEEIQRDLTGIENKGFDVDS